VAAVLLRGPVYVPTYLLITTYYQCQNIEKLSTVQRWTSCVAVLQLQVPALLSLPSCPPCPRTCPRASLSNISQHMTTHLQLHQLYNAWHQFPVSVEAKLSFVEPGRRWAHSPSHSKAPAISYQGTRKTSVRMSKTSGGL